MRTTIQCEEGSHGLCGRLGGRCHCTCHIDAMAVRPAPRRAPGGKQNGGERQPFWPVIRGSVLDVCRALDADFNRGLGTPRRPGVRS